MNNLKLEDLLNKLRTYNPDEVNIVKKAYDYASILHDGQFRQSGEPYISHPLNVAYILAEMHADKDTVCAGLLHDILEDTKATKEEIAELFNKDIANLVDGVTKISKMNFSSKAEQNLANTRKIITGLTEDVRIIIIKLADRLHNMKTLGFKSEFKQKENSLETMEIFVPLAYYIGAYRIKSELEDISFGYLYPKEYKDIEERLNNKKLENESCLNEMLLNIEEILNNELISHEIKVRTKNIYGIYKRLDCGHKKIYDIHDLLSLKIMVDDIKNCYITLGLIHDKYHPINDRFKDYICNPKTNLYRSLHSTVFGPNEKLVQTQIRTFDMDKVASFGLTAHWDINKGDARYTMQEELRKKSQVFKSLSDVNIMFKDNQDFVSQVKGELFSDKVYVYLPNLNGEVIEVPKGANIVDLACYMNLENILIGAKVNDEIVSIDYCLNNKDRVIVLTDDLAYGNRKDLIEKANTEYAKKKIKKGGV